MNSTTKRLTAELQYAKRAFFSSVMRKLPSSGRREINNMTDQLYRELVQRDKKINKTDIFRLLASLGAFSALSDPNFEGSS